MGRPASASRQSAANRAQRPAQAESRYPTPPSAPRCALQSRAGLPARSFGGPWLRREMVVSGEDKAGGTIFAEACDFVLFQHPECLGRIIWPLHVGRVEHVTQFVAREPAGMRVP